MAEPTKTQWRTLESRLPRSRESAVLLVEISVHQNKPMSSVSGATRQRFRLPRKVGRDSLRLSATRGFWLTARPAHIHSSRSYILICVEEPVVNDVCVWIGTVKAAVVWSRDHAQPATLSLSFQLEVAGEGTYVDEHQWCQESITMHRKSAAASNILYLDLT